MPKNHPKTNTDKVLARFILVVLVLILVGFYGILAIPVAYSKKILPNISVAGINLGGQDLERAKSLLEYESQHFDKIKITLNYKEYKFTPSLSELGVSVDIDKTIKKAYSPQITRGLWNDLKYHLGFNKPNEVLYEIIVDEKKYDNYFKKLAKHVKRSPVNASLTIDGAKVNIVPGKDGLTLTADETKPQIIAALQQGEIKSFTLKTKNNPPSIQEPQTKNAKAQAEKWIRANVTVTIKYDQKADQTRDDQSFSASGAQVGSWIYFKEGEKELETRLSASAISGWLQGIASQGTISPINKRIQVVDNKQKILSQGKQGQEPNVSGITSKIVTTIRAGGGKITVKTTKVEPQEEIIGGFLLGRFKGKYIEIVLSQQKLYAINGKKLVNSFIMSSGKIGMDTPIGRFKIIRKALGVSCLPSPTEYKTCFMPYTMSFTSEGHAIHELPIIDGVREGHWHLGYRASHGCVRLGVGPAAYMYNWTPEGTPVIIHN